MGQVELVEQVELQVLVGLQEQVGQVEPQVHQEQVEHLVRAVLRAQVERLEQAEHQELMGFQEERYIISTNL
jgi:hypothetical protein